MGVVKVDSDSTLERDCHMRSVIDHDTTLIVIECESSRNRARHRKDVVGMTCCLFGKSSVIWKLTGLDMYEKSHAWKCRV